MFNNKLSRLKTRRFLSLEDAERSFYDLTNLLGQFLVTHDGRTVTTNRADNGALSDGSTAIFEQTNDGTYDSGTAHDNTSADQAHALYVRRGSARFGPTFFDEPPWAAFVCTTTAKWADGTPPTVAASHSTLGAISVLLADTTTQDPNIRSGESILVIRGDDGNYYALDSHLDGKVGDAKYWLGTVANIPPGWRLLNASGTYDARGRYVKMSSSATLADQGTTGGSNTHSHTGTTDAGGAHEHGGITENASPGTSLNGSHNHSGTTASGGSGNTGDATVGTLSNAGSHSTATTNATTGITIDAGGDHSPASGGNATLTIGAASVTVDATMMGLTTTVADDINLTGSDTGHTHGLNSHTHTIPDHNHTVDDFHTHTETSPGHHHTTSAHTHTYTTSTDGTHSHTVNAHGHVIDTEAAHTHTFTTGTSSNDPAHIIFGLIERYE